MAFTFCVLSFIPGTPGSSKAGYIAMLPKPIFIPSGGLFYLCLRYWPQSMLFIILMRFIDALFLCSIYGTMSLDSLRPGLGPPDWHWPLLIFAYTEQWLHIGG